MVGTRKDEISAILKEQIKGFNYDLEMREVGTVVEVGDGIARVYGLEDAMASEIVQFPNDVFGLVLNLEEESVGVALFGETELVQEGDEVRRTGRVLETVVGEALLGRVVDPLGRPKDGKGPIDAKEHRKAEIKAPGVIERQPVNTPLQTGLKSIDALTPIGRGQRELIIGDRQTGKTAVAIDTIVNQKGQGVICVYVAIGQKASTVASVVQKLTQHGAMEYTIVVAANAGGAAISSNMTATRAVPRSFMAKSSVRQVCEALTFDRVYPVRWWRLRESRPCRAARPVVWSRAASDRFSAEV